MRLTLCALALLVGAGCSTTSKAWHVITDYGAVGDGKTLDTAAIQKAIDACAAGGGGIVEVPSGTFLSGAFELKSDMCFLQVLKLLEKWPMAYSIRRTNWCLWPVTQARKL